METLLTGVLAILLATLVASPTPANTILYLDDFTASTDGALTVGTICGMKGVGAMCRGGSKYYANGVAFGTTVTSGVISPSMDMAAGGAWMHIACAGHRLHPILLTVGKAMS